ncbi:MAG: Rhodanese domain protein [Verrucomicrobiaceae bacterium]|nr:Rhodanese domain protein [Verrucomicrobiaceae bacterium]
MNSPALLYLCTGLLVTSCGKPPTAAPLAPPQAVLPAAYAYVSPDEAEKLIASTPPLGILDVRDQSEMHEVGMISGARPCPYLSDNTKMLHGFDRKQPFLVYCAIGGRSEYTAEAMSQLGFEHVYILKGGINAWRAAKKPVVK